jgi:crotonobetainyl-CoA:carnitine CoA-transferase CaiB-like acyl-CoA transferase
MATSPGRSGPLAGMRVIELAHIMAGPVCGLMLADMGAEVIKVEKMDGDDTRRTVPPALEGESAAYMMMNRGKRGISLDLKDPDGVAVLRRLLKGADALIENYRGGTMERLGIGYETLRQEFPELVYCSLSGFGRSGPYADRAGFDLVAQGMSGLMSVTGEGPGRPPMKCGRLIPTGSGPAGVRRSTPRCSRPGSPTPTGNRPSPWRPASRPDPWARPIP